MGAWGPGIYQNDDALDLRDRWRRLVRAGLDPKDVGRRLVDELDLSDDADDSPSWLALADLLWRAGRLAPEMKRRVLQIIRRGDLEAWGDGQRKARRRVLDELGKRLVSRMPAPVRIQPRHPCDWKRGEHIVWRMADGTPAVLRVVGFDRNWGGGGSPVVELVAAGGPDESIDRTTFGDRPALQASKSLTLTTGKSWRGTRFKLGVFEAGAYPARRVRRLSPSSPARRIPGTKIKPLATRWDALDGFLFRGFDLPWPTGAVLRVPAIPSPVWVVVAEVMTLSGSPAVVCEVLDWHENRELTRTELHGVDTHRTTDTVSSVRARVVDPRNRQSIAQMKRHLGVRSVDERAPFRMMLLGYPPSGTKVVGRRRVLAPGSGVNAVGWADLGTVVRRLMENHGRTAMDDLDPAPWG